MGVTFCPMSAPLVYISLKLKTDLKSPIDVEWELSPITSDGARKYAQKNQGNFSKQGEESNLSEDLCTQNNE